MGGSRAGQNFKMKIVQLIFNIFIFSHAIQLACLSNINYEIITKGIAKEMVNIPKKESSMSTPYKCTGLGGFRVTSLNPH